MTNLPAQITVAPEIIESIHHRNIKMTTPEELQTQFAAELKKLEGFEKEKTKAVSSRQQLEAQLTENCLVKDELDRLEADAVVYKLIGPVLVKQDLVEARQNVDKRIDFIKNEVKRQEAALEEVGSKQESVKESLQKIQAIAQKVQARPGIKA